mgnify:CR=1 FL=1
MKSEIKDSLRKATAKEQNALVKETISNVVKSDKLLSASAKKFKDIINKGYDGCTIPIMRIRSYTEKDKRIVEIVIVSIMMISVDEHKPQEIDRLKSMKKAMLK